MVERRGGEERREESLLPGMLLLPVRLSAWHAAAAARGYTAPFAVP